MKIKLVGGGRDGQEVDAPDAPAFVVPVPGTGWMGNVRMDHYEVTGDGTAAYRQSYRNTGPLNAPPADLPVVAVGAGT